VDTTIALSRKERRKAQEHPESLPVAISDVTESIESVDAVEPTEALKTAPTGSLPLTPVATTGSLPVSMLSGAVSVHKGINLSDDDDIDDSPKKYRRFVTDIMDEDDVSLEEAELIFQAELEAEDPELAARLREADIKTKQAKADAKKAKQNELLKQVEAKVKFKRSKLSMFVSLALALVFTTVFILMGGF
jgi:hypothetical protein